MATGIESTQILGVQVPGFRYSEDYFAAMQPQERYPFLQRYAEEMGGAMATVVCVSQDERFSRVNLEEAGGILRAWYDGLQLQFGLLSSGAYGLELKKKGSDTLVANLLELCGGILKSLGRSAQTRPYRWAEGAYMENSPVICEWKLPGSVKAKDPPTLGAYGKQYQFAIPLMRIHLPWEKVLIPHWDEKIPANYKREANLSLFSRLPVTSDKSAKGEILENLVLHPWVFGSDATKLGFEAKRNIKVGVVEWRGLKGPASSESARFGGWKSDHVHVHNKGIIHFSPNNLRVRMGGGDCFFLLVAIDDTAKMATASFMVQPKECSDFDREFDALQQLRGAGEAPSLADALALLEKRLVPEVFERVKIYLERSMPLQSSL